MYFGSTKDDPKGEKALTVWVAEKDYCMLHGKRPVAGGAGLTVADCAIAC